MSALAKSGYMKFFLLKHQFTASTKHLINSIIICTD